MKFAILTVKFTVLSVALALALPAQAQHDPSQQFKPMPERRDVLSWRLLSQVELVKLKDRYVPQFSSGITALDQKQVKVQGFMMPLQTGDKQTHFVLAAMPQTCAFCLPGGPEQMVEVKASKAVKYTFEPVVVSGKLSVLKEDPTGIFYRIAEGTQSD